MDPMEAMTQPSALDGKVTVMPTYYVPKDRAKGKGTSPKLLAFVIGGTVLVVLIVLGALLFVNSSGQPASPLTPSEPSNQTPQAPAITPTEPEPEEEAAPPVEAQPTIETETPSILLPELSLGAIPNDVDTDQDGLTDVEEQLFATSPAVPDSDQDSYLDGAEVANLYDPATKGALLEVSPQVKIAKNDTKGYQLLVPVSWRSSKQTPAGDRFIIQPSSGQESFEINVYDNPDRLTAVQWYQQMATLVNLNQFVNFENEAGWAGIQSRDGLLVIATLGENEPGARAYIFVMHYDPGEQQLLTYPSVWKMMTHSLAVLEEDDDGSDL